MIFIWGTWRVGCHRSASDLERKLISVRDMDSSLLSPETIDFLKLACSKSLFWDGLG